MRCPSEVLLPGKNPNWPFESIFCSIANLVILRTIIVNKVVYNEVCIRGFITW